ncbi:MAG: RHS repeat-associated core domain-containing protein [Acidobacteriota bacterium]
MRLLRSFLVFLLTACVAGITLAADPISPLDSGAADLGLFQNAPGVSYNEYTGDVATSIDIGVPGLSIPVHYSRDRQLHLNAFYGANVLDGNQLRSGAMGTNWHVGWGYVVGRRPPTQPWTPPAHDTDAVDTDLSRLAAYVGPDGRSTAFTRDYLFQQVPDPLPLTWVDRKWIDGNLRRLELLSSTTWPWLYTLNDVDGTRMTFQAAFDPGSTDIMHFYPTRIELPNRRRLDIVYVGGLGGALPAGSQPDLRKRIDQVIEFAGPSSSSPIERIVHFHYDTTMLGFPRLTRLTLEKPGEPSESLGSFEHHEVTVAGVKSVNLMAFETPEGMRTGFEVGAVVGNGGGTSTIPALTAITLPTGGRVELDYADVLEPFQQCDVSDLSTGEGTTDGDGIGRLRLDELSHSGQTYRFEYLDVLDQEPDGQLRVRVTTPDPTDPTNPDYVNVHDYIRVTDYHHRLVNPTSTGGLGACSVPTAGQPDKLGLWSRAGQPLRRQQAHNGKLIIERWEYITPLLASNGGQWAVQTQLHKPLVAKYEREIDNRTTVTRFTYELTNNLPTASALSTDLIFPVEIESYPFSAPSKKIEQFFDYEHRFSTSTGWVASAHHVLGLRTFAEERYEGDVRGRQLTTYLPEVNTYTPILPISTTEYTDNGTSRTTDLDYYLDPIADGASFGLLKSRTLGGYTTTYEDYVRGVPTRIIHPLGPDTEQEVDLAGNVTWRRADGIETTFHFDDDQRLRRTVRPGPFEDRLVDYSFDVNDVFYTFERFTSRPDTESFVDPWGRPRYLRRFVDQGVDDIRWTDYDAYGRVDEIFENGGVKITELKHDLLDRVTSEVIKENGSVLRTVDIAYDHQLDGTVRVTRSTRAEGIGPALVRIQETDFGGRVIKASTNGHETNLSYVAVPDGLATTITPDGGSQRVLVHNWLGELVAEEHPELGPSGGTVEHRYDDRGFKIEEIYPDLRQEFDYDGLGRLTERRCGGPGPYGAFKVCATYEYSATNNQLVRAESINQDSIGSWVEVIFSDFNELNLPATQDTTISVWSDHPNAPSSRSFNQQYVYDALGRLTEHMYPRDLYQPQFQRHSLVYDLAYNQGQTEVTWHEAGIDYPVAGITLDSKLRPADVAYTDSAWSNAGALAVYRFDQLNRPTEWSLQRNGVIGRDYEAYNFDYNEWGFVERYFRDDNLFVGGSIIDPTYDSKGELDTYAIDGQLIDYTYDSKGNLTGRTGGGLLMPIQVSLPTVSHSYGSGNPFHNDAWTYDLDGRVTWDGEASYEYNRSGRIFKWRALIHGNLYSQRNVYDPFGKRVATIEPNEVAYTVRDRNGRAVIQERYEAQAAKETGTYAGRDDYVYQNGQLLAVRKRGADRASYMTWRFQDWLGSTAVSWQGNNTADFVWHSPYGDKGNYVNGRAVGLMGPGGFTEHENDTTGLVYMQARFMDPLAARFNRPDPGRDFTPALPHTYNLYQYARNNPLGFVDPDGRLSNGVYETRLGDLHITYVDFSRHELVRQGRVKAAERVAKEKFWRTAGFTIIGAALGRANASRPNVDAVSGAAVGFAAGILSDQSYLTPVLGQVTILARQKGPFGDKVTRLEAIPNPDGTFDIRAVSRLGTGAQNPFMTDETGVIIAEGVSKADLYELLLRIHESACGDCNTPIDSEAEVDDSDEDEKQ